MDHYEDVTKLPDEFDGRVRLFPLPGLVVFPHAMQPLHVFESRYCDMLAEAMAGDQLIAMASIDPNMSVQPTSESGFDVDSLNIKPVPRPDPHSPPIDRHVCLGRIVSHSEVEDDRHNILLVGIRRARIRQEVDASRPFRVADVDIREDVYPPEGAKARLALKGKLLDAFGKAIPKSESVQKNLYDLMAGQMPLGPITDIISYMLPFEMPQKLRLLAAANVDYRAEQLVEMLNDSDLNISSLSVETKATEISSDEGGQGEGRLPFPPPFSVN